MSTNDDQVSACTAEFNHSRVSLVVQGVALEVATIHRTGSLAPVIFLHGFGSTKEDYADIVRHVEFSGRAFLAWDAPGCGETHCGDLGRVSIPFLVDTARAMLARFGVTEFHLVGHSMGGLTALLLAHAMPERVLSFVDIEGNLASEDCFLSRQIIDYPADDPQHFFDEFILRTHGSPAYASALYAASLRHKVRTGAVAGIFRSMVELSDHGDLMDKFLSLPMPRMFMHGEQNAKLSYLPRLREAQVRVEEVPSCGHFPMYSNPLHMWSAIAKHMAS